jgi:hypothetical protein
MEAIDLPNRSDKSIGHTINNEAEMKDRASKEMGNSGERRQYTKRARWSRLCAGNNGG